MYLSHAIIRFMTYSCAFTNVTCTKCLRWRGLKVFLLLLFFFMVIKQNGKNDTQGLADYKVYLDWVSGCFFIWLEKLWACELAFELMLECFWLYEVHQRLFCIISNKLLTLLPLVFLWFIENRPIVYRPHPIICNPTACCCFVDRKCSSPFSFHTESSTCE